MKKIGLTLVAVAALGVAACNNAGDATANNTTDINVTENETASDVNAAADEAGNATTALGNAGDAIGNAASDAGNVVENGADAVGDAVSNAAHSDLPNRGFRSVQPNERATHLRVRGPFYLPTVAASCPWSSRQGSFRTG